jgi:hypothetical protein
VAPGTMMWPTIVRTGSSNREISSSLFRQSRSPLRITGRTRKPVPRIKYLVAGSRPPKPRVRPAGGN